MFAQREALALRESARPKETPLEAERRLSIGDKLTLLWGKIRRFYYHTCRPDYISRSHKRRMGTCLRCGVCCQIGARCPHYEEALDAARQGAAFREAVGLLAARGNRVFVVVGPFNPHMLKPKSLERYREVQGEIAAWLEANHPDYHMAPELPSEAYGDSSHPLGEGYRRAAQSLYNDARFRRWVEV